ncbi:Protein FAM184B [Lonchura striata]|uniref:Protein FAM184B n=1 Tax=Lonchura striata TaxID=40157 RepID=A0A218VC88_9PASE|nr:Protein FAM184B [Lonchura striata domestica]
MHVKMCKKIAQLTKVIYALNTKNDEYEDSIQALREAHEEEIQNILAETRETILQCKSKIEEEQLLRKHIQALEVAVAQHKRLKEEALAELILCRKQAEEESRTKEKKAQTGLSTDTVDNTAGFENKLPHLNREFDGLLHECKALRGENPDTKVNLDEKCSMERHSVMNEMENLKSKNQKTSEEYTQKTRKLQTPCETEEETLKKAMQQSVLETNCQQGEMEQKMSSEAEEGFLLQQVKKLEADLEEKSQKINERRKHSQKLKERIQELQAQLDEFKRKSECELKQLEKEKEILTGKLQNSSLEVAQLKQILEQQANNFKESLKKHNLQSNKEKEKLLQDLQNTIKENQNVKLHLEASHQKVLKMLEKSKNQELKEAEERLRKEFNETFKIQHQSHRLEIQTLEEKAKKELHDELEQIQKQQTLLLGIVSHVMHSSYCLIIYMLRTTDFRPIHFLSHLLGTQEGSSQSQIISLHNELEKCQSEISELKRENLLLKDAMELLSAELESQKQEAGQLQDREKQHRRFALNSHLRVLSRDSIIMPEIQTYFNTNERLLVEDLNIKHRKELDILKQDHRKEIENIVSDFSSTQAHLQAKIFSLETALKELEEKSRKWESRPEDTHLINCLQDKLSEREEIIKQLVKKKVEMPSRVVSVPNLASYAKSFLSGDLRSKRSAPQITKSASLDRSSGCLRVGSPSTQSSDSGAATRYLSILLVMLMLICLHRTHGTEPPQTKDDQKQDPQHQEWFTKYFSF